MATSSEDWIKRVYALENNTKCTHLPGIKIEYYKYPEQRLPSFYVCIKHWEVLLNADSASEGLRLGVWVCISIRLGSDAAGARTTR